MGAIFRVFDEQGWIALPCVHSWNGNVPLSRKHRFGDGEKEAWVQHKKTVKGDELGVCKAVQHFLREGLSCGAICIDPFMSAR